MFFCINYWKFKTEGQFDNFTYNKKMKSYEKGRYHTIVDKGSWCLTWYHILNLAAMGSLRRRGNLVISCIINNKKWKVMKKMSWFLTWYHNHVLNLAAMESLRRRGNLVISHTINNKKWKIMKKWSNNVTGSRNTRD